MITHQSTPGMNPAPLPPAVTAMTAMTAMTAIVQDEYGNAADVLRLAEIDRPEIAAGEVLLRVHAAGIDRGVWHLMAGLPYPVRFAGYGIRAPKTKVRGREVAGTVVALGAEVTTLKVGDEVFGIGEGCFAEYAAARADTLAPKPRNLTFVQASAVSVSALTALQAVRDGADVQPGQQVLIIGASGGVGAFADQIAKTFGAEVTGVCSTSKADVVRFAGADHVIEYTREDITAGARRYDVILDIGGNRSLTHLRRALTDKGTLAPGWRKRRTLARRLSAATSRAPAVRVRRPAPALDHGVGELGRPAGAARTHRVASGDTGRRSDLPAERDPGRGHIRGGRAGSWQGRHHHVNRLG